ncbi:hypothetical protein FB451DRAFT_131383 [Mycena latifolia]|nr:hypothetical protein FB451DRAFT_131383 [Mycena latifolia]
MAVLGFSSETRLELDECGARLGFWNSPQTGAPVSGCRASRRLAALQVELGLVSMMWWAFVVLFRLFHRLFLGVEPRITPSGIRRLERDFRRLFHILCPTPLSLFLVSHARRHYDARKAYLLQPFARSLSCTSAHPLRRETSSRRPSFGRGQ